MTVVMLWLFIWSVWRQLNLCYITGWVVYLHFPISLQQSLFEWGISISHESTLKAQYVWTLAEKVLKVQAASCTANWATASGYSSQQCHSNKRHNTFFFFFFFPKKVKSTSNKCKDENALSEFWVHFPSNFSDATLQNAPKHTVVNIATVDKLVFYCISTQKTAAHWASIPRHFHHPQS